ncbi:hypothetical protein MIR68_007054 [Amoeboaphelidium protococcarum]|nr:hypothetical protein MIR68_007054 [Amoeboaphelidium protococcarum]
MDYQDLPEHVDSDVAMADIVTKQNQIPVPTDDGQVRAILRRVGQPMTLFGEGAYERRNRLRSIMAEYSDFKVNTLLQWSQSIPGGDYRNVPIHGVSGVSNGDDQNRRQMQERMEEETGEQMEDEDGDLEQDGNDYEEFFIQGGPAVRQMRSDIARFSLPRTRHRLSRQRMERQYIQSNLDEFRAYRQDLYLKLRGNNSRYQEEAYQMYGIQIASDRALSRCQFSPHNDLLAVGCFGGSLKLWTLPQFDDDLGDVSGDCEVFTQLHGHQDRVTSIAWNPTLDESNVHLASGGMDGSCFVWSIPCNDTGQGSQTTQIGDGGDIRNESSRTSPVLSLDGHSLRVSATKFHPSGRYLATGSYDASWRLWDLSVGMDVSLNGDGGTRMLDEEVLLQEGHMNGVHSLDINWDGSLLASGGVRDGLCRMFDLRTGKNIMLIPPAATWNQMESSDSNIRLQPSNPDGHHPYSTITQLAYSPNGFDLASASTDGFVKVHDLRMLRVAKCTIAAAGSSGIVSGLQYRQRRWSDYYESKADYAKSFKFLQTIVGQHCSQNQPSDSEITSKNQEPEDIKSIPDDSLAQYHADYMVTSSFDGFVKIWSCNDYRLLKTLDCSSMLNMDSMTDGDSQVNRRPRLEKLMDVSQSSDGRWLASAQYDKAFSLFHATDLDAQQ